MFAKIQCVHFVGIGGIGMSGIAEVLLTLGYRVTGSDLKSSAATNRLAWLGAMVHEGHRPQNVHGAEVVVISSAVGRDNPEVVEARRLKIPVIQRAEMLAELMRLKYGIAVAGMHGKTTTTSMIAAVLAAGGFDPTVVVGGRVDAMGSNARLGRSQYLVAEADESDRSFLKLSPILAVVTNIDREHMDCYRDMEDIEQTFLQFMDRVPFYGMVVGCNDDDLLRPLLARVERRTVTYGLRPDSSFRISQVVTGLAPGAEAAAAGSSVIAVPLSYFHVHFGPTDLGEFCLQVPGNHNVLNAAAAIAVGIGLDIRPDHIRGALENFRGVDRRFQIKGKARGVTVIDDYGHHPTEIRSTLAAARQCGYSRVHVIFQPHRYTRTRDLMDDFGTAFNAADSICVLDIYAASEPPLEGIDAQAVVRRVAAAGGNVSYAASFDEAASAAVHAAQPGDAILTLGAGSISHLGPQLLVLLEDSTSGRVHHTSHF
ncbi:MAG TPA: UDP-N-acetylmuramate--L-alanine ligase [Terriglobales bacterium]|nr:UDP-N-acetylmuramate--L-alanine ligase [Terriglobales bacterium]